MRGTICKRSTAYTTGAHPISGAHGVGINALVAVAALENKRVASRNRRLLETEVEKNARRTKDAEKKRLKRAAENAEKNEERRARNASAQRVRLSQQTEEERRMRRDVESKRNRQRLLDETEDEADARKARVAAGKRQRKINETQEEGEARRASHAQYVRLRSQYELQDEADDRKGTRAAKRRQHLEDESDGERAKRLENVAQRKKKRENAEDSNTRNVRLAKRNAQTKNNEQKKNQRRSSKLFQINNIDQIDEHYLGKMNKECAHCGALLFEASMGAQLDVPPGHGPYCFKIHGQVYHHAGPLHPPSGKRPSYGQIYILDTAQAAQERLTAPANIRCDRGIMEELSKLIADINPYAQSYKMMMEVENQEKHAAQQAGNPVKQVRMVFDLNAIEDLDQRRYNVPIVSEVAVIYVAQDGDVPLKRSIAAQSHDGSLTHFRDIDPCVDPMIYPLFFPRGHPGWSTEMKRKPEDEKSGKLTLLAYYKYLLQEKSDVFSPLHYGGGLFQQFVVDSWVKVEQSNLNFVRFNQATVRAKEYSELRDFMDRDEPGVIPGRRIVLPSGFKGSARRMMQEYQDAMSMVTERGKPDFFLTLTCNPKWREITENLKPGQQSFDRPDLIARVFKLKVDELMRCLLNLHVIGQVRSYLYVFEWQKRGLPHIHMLLTMCEGFKPKTADDVDKLIWAEFPDAHKFPILHKIVTSNMVHRPCGLDNIDAPCMKASKNKGLKTCSKRFPKAFRADTKVESNGYPEYRRRDDGRYVDFGKFKLTNQHVVPYSPLLLLRFNAHINLEVCALIESVKYLFKYVYKGPDKAAIRLRREQEPVDDDVIDEINDYLDCRYICAPEACHHLFSFKTAKKSDTIYRLAVHLPDCQTVYFTEGNERNALNSAAERKTILTGFFDLNAEFSKMEKEGKDVTGRQDPRLYTYVEFPKHFTWNKTKRVWNDRKDSGANTIGRMYGVSPSDPERFALRLLLLHKRGPTSFEDLRTTNDVQGTAEVHETFVLAARALGLLQDDTEYIRALKECAHFKMPAEMRSFFAELLGFNEIGDPQHLWDKFKKDMSADFLHGGYGIDEAEALAYQAIEEKLTRLGKSINKFLAPCNFVLLGGPQDYIDHDAAMVRGNQLYETLNPEQKTAFEAILKAVDDPSLPRVFYIDGPGGSGKTYLYNALCSTLIGRQMKIACTAWTGIASTLLPNGRTSASLFKLDINNDCEGSTLMLDSAYARHLKDLDVIIWDEASMIPKNALQTADQVLRDVAEEGDKRKMFGGKVFVVGGDFRQVLPVVRRGTRSDQVDACIKRSPLWSSFQVHKLMSNMRVNNNDSSWKDFLLNVGDGLANDANGELQLEESLISKGDIITETFGVSIDQSTDLSESAVIAPKNVDVDKLNEQVLSRICGTEKVYLSRDEIIDDNQNKFMTTELLNSIQTSSLPPHQLHLKIGCSVMLLRNLDVSAGLCNGTRLIVQEMGQRVLRCTFAVGTRKEEGVLIPRIHCADDKNLAFKMRRTQFPVRLAFAMTLNKAQGQSFNRIGLWLPCDVFSHGQLYVALSRVRSKGGLKILSENPNPLNVVYTEVL
uniref:ATP-dependent DNA helicase n=1 Tax=Caenorhabditis japonica TaxID=281687 RepID=A0A8R1HSI7_CAEJA